MGFQDAGLAELAGLCVDTGSPTAFDYIAYGDDTTAHDSTHTTLQGTESQRTQDSSTSRTTTNVTNDTAVIDNTFSITSTETIGESGVFNDATTGTMLCRQVLSPTRSVVNGDSWTATWNIVMAGA